jgi:hypothetical protein
MMAPRKVGLLVGREWSWPTITHTADLAIDLATNPRPPLRELRWNGRFER